MEASDRVRRLHGYESFAYEALRHFSIANIEMHRNERMTKDRFSESEAFTIWGHWWLPGEPDRIAGELRYDVSQIELRLMGGLHSAISQGPLRWLPEESSPRVIHGESKDGEAITLLDTFYSSWKPSVESLAPCDAPMASSKLIVHGVAIGAHLASDGEQRFVRARIRMPNLSKWLRVRPFKIKRLDDDAGEKGIGIEGIVPEEAVYELVPPFRLVRIAYGLQTSGGMDESITMWRRPFIEIESAAPENLEWYNDQIARLEDFLTLLVGLPVQTSERKLYLASRAGEGGPTDSSALLYLPRRRVESVGQDHWEVLAPFPIVKEWLLNALKQWLTNTEEIRHARSLFFSTLREPGAFLETRFLPVVQAIEVYGRQIVPGGVVEKAAWKAMHKVLKDAIPEEAPVALRESIINALAFANEPRLKQRFHALIDELEDDTVELFCLDRESFVRGVVDTRNYFTHYSKSPRYVLEGLDLHWATRKLQTMLVILLLKRIGIPETSIRGFVGNNHRLRQERLAWETVSERGSSNRA